MKHTTNQAETGGGNAPRVHPAGLGRGSNPKSRANLKTPIRNWEVFVLGTDSMWHCLKKGLTCKAAYQWASKLEALNGTSRKPMFVAQRGA